jgi:hypothetical protein
MNYWKGRMNPIPERALRYAQGFSGLRSDDDWLASFPKSGNTWIRFFLGNLISLHHWKGRVVDFTTLDETMPELGVSNLLQPWQFDVIPRFVKTHWRFVGRFRGRKSVLVVRDPRVVMLSYYNFDRARTSPRFHGSFSEFVRHRKFGLKAWFRHTKSWQNEATVVIRFEDLKADDVREFTHMLEGVGARVPLELVAEAARRARFENVRKVEEQFGHSKPDQYRSGFRFTRSGKTATWRELFSQAELDLYQDLKSRFAVDLY